MRIRPMVRLGWIATCVLWSPSSAGAATPVTLGFGDSAQVVVFSGTWNPRSVDLGVVIQATGGMGALAAVKAQLPTTISALQASYPDLRVGVADYEDWPCSGFGDPTPPVLDVPFHLDTRCTSNTSVQTNALLALTADGGGDALESGYDALMQAVTGSGVSAAGCGNTTVPPFNPSQAAVAGVADGNDGGMGFRADGRSMPMLVFVANHQFHEASDYPFAGPASSGAARGALTASGLRFGAVLVQDLSLNGTLPAQLQTLSADARSESSPAFGSPAGWCNTGLGGAAVMPDGSTGMCPSVYQVTSIGTGFGTAFAAVVHAALDHAPFTLSRSAAGGALPGSGTAADFVKHMAFSTPTNSAPAPAPSLAPDSATVDGSYAGGGFDLAVRLRNDIVPETRSDQTFALVVRVFAGLAQVDSFPIQVTVPANLAGVETGRAGSASFTVAGPNPFAGATALRLTAPDEGPAEVSILDVQGRHVRTLFAGTVDAGAILLRWTGDADDGRQVPGGVYVARATWRGTEFRRMVARIR